MSAEAVQAAVAQRFSSASTGNDPETSQPGGNEFVIFSKPELGSLDGAHLDLVWDLFASAFGRYDVTVHRVKTLTGPELEASGLMQQHYGVINQISRLGREALTESAEEALREALGDRLDAAEVLGGHQFLERYPEFSPFALATLFSNAGASRLGPGSYAVAVNVDGTTVVILNGFHPRQLGFFTADGAVCAFLHASSPTTWETLRADLIGATDPAKAAAGSIRGTLRADPGAYGLTAVNSNFNGVHMSAGPLEGLGELGRFFPEVAEPADWTFAAALRDRGASESEVAALLDNPVLAVNGERGTAFDLTEGLDAGPAADLLVSAEQG